MLRLKKSRVGRPKGSQTPHLWISGPDPVRHQQYRAWAQQANQARWRGEGWSIPFDQWLEIWGDLWKDRGRRLEAWCMTRRDWDLEWSSDNVEVVTRREFLERAREARPKPHSKKKMDTSL